MAAYNHKDIEKKWQKKWEEEGLNRTTEGSDKKFYILDMFPYPSGEGLHVGHPKGYIATDVYSRMKRMQGYDVLHPMGFDAFGLPAEQYALKNKVNPNVSTAKNVARYKEQLKMLGLNYDWDREVNTTDPKFYKWTQWMWKQMYKKGLAYESYDPINWCPSCKTGLANEDLENGKCERCGSNVEKKPLRQWTIRITDYADRLLADLDKLDWEPHIKELQRNWIGRNYGLKYKLKVKGVDMYVETYSTHYEAFCADTFAVIAADHKLLPELISNITNKEEILLKAKEISVLRNSAGFKADEIVEGIFTGIYLEDPITKKDLPLWVSSYALADYGTGIIKCSAHDERDFAFAKKYGIDLHLVLLPDDSSIREKVSTHEICFSDFTYSTLLEPEIFKGKKPHDIREEIADYIAQKGWAVKSTQYKLKDWVFARQRYWGEPFPIVFDENHTSYAVADSELPVVLPMVDEYEPTGTGESPLANIKEWVEIYGYINIEGEFASIPSTVAEKVPVQFLDINDDGGRDSYQPKKEIKERSNVACIIKHPTEDKYLISKWRKVTWNGFVTGGIEDGETAEDAARKEVLEETGFTAVKSVSLKDFTSHGLFYHPIKEENRFAHYRLAVVELSSLDRQEVDEAEQAICDFVWVDKEEVEALLTRFDMRSLWQFYIHGKVTEEPKRKVKKFKRETNTMPQWAGSSWYYLRYIDPHNDTMFVDSVKEQKWSPVDFYVGGAEHATRHLIYARFWHKFFFDLGLVSHDEPFTKLQTVGLIMAEDGRKMSKRWGNIVNPDDVVEKYGADTLRLYEMFMGPFDQSVAWSTSSMAGVNRFIERFFRLKEKVNDAASLTGEVEILFNQTIKKVGDDILEFKFNTAISQMMILLNALEKEEGIPGRVYKGFVQMVAPFAPHVGEELWRELGEEESVHISSWPLFDQTKLAGDTVTVALQIGGKMRGAIVVCRDIEDDQLMELVKVHEQYVKYVADTTPKKVIIIKNKIVNIVI